MAKEALSNDTKAYNEFRDWARSLERLNEAKIIVRKLEADLKSARNEEESAIRSEKERFDRLDWYRTIAYSGGTL